MKRILLRIGIVIVLLLIVAILAVTFFLDGAVKRGVETVGPRLTKVQVKLDGVTLSLLSGSGKIKGLLVGNPEGYKTPQALTVGSARIDLKPTSLLSDKVVIKKIEVIAPEITFEGGFGGNNLSKIRANINETTGGGGTNAAAKPATEKPGKKLQIDDFLISGAKLHVSVTGMGGKSIAVPMPDIHFSDLGTGPEGITAGELLNKVWQAIEENAVKVADKAVADLGKTATGIATDAAKPVTGAVSNLIKSPTDLFKKK